MTCVRSIIENMENSIEEKELTFVPPKLWVIEFNVRSIGKGCAIVKAHNPEDAIQILKTNGMYNGSQEDYLITKVEEVVVPPCCGLMAEEIITYAEYR